MRIYDVTVPITNMTPVWPGDPPPSIQRVAKIEDGADANVSKLEMSVHLGTHVDAPYHFLGSEAATIDQLPLNLLIGRAYVLQLDDKIDTITARELEAAEIPPRTRRLLFKTRNSRLWERNDGRFVEDFVAVSADGAQYLVDRGIKLVGIDYLSVAPYAEQTPTHQILLSAGVVIIEGLDLSKVSQGRYTLYCLPLKIAGADGAPARVILVGV